TDERMEMIEGIYANAEVIGENRAESCDNRNSYEDIYANQDNLERQRPRSFNQSESSGGDTAWSRYCRLTAVCVVLLCVLLLTVITVLWIKFSQLQSSNNSLTIERDELQTSNKNLTIERDQLQRERDEYLGKFCGL
ncbi:antigen like protein, partial [Clarias magur]